ncbi:MAG: PAS domain S-box protein [Anaerolineae bacterium]|nr:PAS domain S-box protein [Anaerolineae bacterium]
MKEIRTLLRPIIRAPRGALSAALQICVAILVLLVLGAATTPGYAQTGPVVRVGVYENAPKIFTADDGSVSGVWPDLIRYIAAEEGWEIEWVHGTWDEGLGRLANNEIDVLPDVAWSAERSQAYALSNEPVLVSWSSLYVPRGSGIETVLDLEGERVAGLAGSINLEGPSGIKDLTRKFDIQPVFVGMDSYSEVFQALQNNEIDAGITNKDFGNLNEGLCDVDRTPIIFQPVHINFAFTRNAALTPYLLQTIDSHVEALKADKDSIYYRSLDHWLGVRQEQTFLPLWARRGLAVALGLFGFFFVASIVLRRQVAAKTRALAGMVTALQESEEKYRGLVDLAQEGIWVIDKDSNTTFVNPSMVKMLGYTADEMIGRHLFSFMDERGVEIAARNVERHKQGIAQQHDFEFLRKDGKRVIVAMATAPIVDGDGDYAGAIAGVMDITERVRTEKERERLLAQIRAQATQMQQTIDTVPEGVVLLGARGPVILANPVAEGDLAVLADGRVGDILRPGSGQAITHLGDRSLAELLTSPPTKGLWHEVKAEDRTFEVIARPIEPALRPTADGRLPNGNGPEPENWVLVIRDVTQERAIEQHTQQQERLAAVGQLAAGIAHDFNNIMAVIVLYVEMGLRLPDIPAQLRERLQVVGQQSRRATALIQQILDFSRRAVLERRPMDLTPFLKEIVKLLERTVPENIKIEFTYGLGEYTVNADPTRMQQAVMNLVLNARDAMLTKGGGKLDIEVDRVQVAGHQKPPLPEMDAGEWVRIAVTDTGEGIPDDVLPHMFEPFYTTKEVGKGTGLGLAQVYGIVKQHEGHIDVTTKVGAGTTFTIYLPALLEDRSEAPATRTEVSVPGQGETILLVEDNAELRKAMAATLEQLNYRVLAAGDGREALAVLQQHVGEVSLVLSDLVMPVMGGKALFYALKEQHPGTKMIMLTGHPMEQELQALQAEGLSGYLLKPPNMEQLAQMVARTLAGESE